MLTICETSSGGRLSRIVVGESYWAFSCLLLRSSTSIYVMEIIRLWDDWVLICVRQFYSTRIKVRLRRLSCSSYCHWWTNSMSCFFWRYYEQVVYSYIVCVSIVIFIFLLIELLLTYSMRIDHNINNNNKWNSFE